MLTIEKKKDAETLTVKLTGQMDTSNAHEFTEALEGELSDVMELRVDMEELEYTTSSGLRALLEAYQELDEKDGRMVLVRVNEEIREILNVTGFDKFLDIES